MRVTNLQTSNMDLPNLEESMEVVLKLKPLEHPFHATTPKGFLHITPIGVFRQVKIIFFSQVG